MKTWKNPYWSITSLYTSKIVSKIWGHHSPSWWPATISFSLPPATVCFAGVLKCSHKVTPISLSVKSIPIWNINLCLWSRLPAQRIWPWSIGGGYSQKLKSWYTPKPEVIYRTVSIFWLTRHLTMCRATSTFSVSEVWSNLMLCI